MLLCPVRALRLYLSRTSRLLPSPRTLFRSPRNPSRSISKNAISFFLRETIMKALQSTPDPGPSIRYRAHSIRGMATSTAFVRNFSIASILEAATWKSSTVFTSFYLKDVSFSFPEGHGLGPFVTVQAICNWWVGGFYNLFFLCVSTSFRSLVLIRLCKCERLLFLNLSSGRNLYLVAFVLFLNIS